MGDPFRDSGLLLERTIALAEENGRLKAENASLRERLEALEAQNEPAQLNADLRCLIEERDALTAQLDQLRARISAVAEINDNLAKAKPNDLTREVAQLQQSNRRLREKIRAYEERDALERDAVARERLLNDS